MGSSTNRDAKSSSTTRHAKHRELVSRVKMLWQRDTDPDAVSFLTEHSNIRHNRNLAIEVARAEEHH